VSAPEIAIARGLPEERGKRTVEEEGFERLPVVLIEGIQEQAHVGEGLSGARGR
jgi:hypothetical protein